MVLKRAHAQATCSYLDPQVPHLFTMDPFDSLKLQIISDCCANQTSGTLTPLAHAL